MLFTGLRRSSAAALWWGRVDFAAKVIRPPRKIAETCGITVSAHHLRRTYQTHAEETDISVMALKALVKHAIGGDVTETTCA